MTTRLNKMEWQAQQHRLEKAGKQADEIIEYLKLAAPINPLDVVSSERPLLRAGGRNLGNRYDGKLEYDRSKNLFLLFYNTKYDEGLPAGVLHPRTRFSIGHELGHYFIEQHRAYLMRLDGHSHASSSEFRSDFQIEREADAFAASLLMPTKQVRSLVNVVPLNVQRLARISDEFKSSIVSTTFRSVRISHFPCAVAGIRDGSINWMYPSPGLIEASIYPRRGGLPPNAQTLWTQFQLGILGTKTGEGKASDWFTIYADDGRESLFVAEEYIPVPAMKTLLVLLSIDEQDFEEEEESDEDE